MPAAQGIVRGHMGIKYVIARLQINRGNPYGYVSSLGFPAGGEAVTLVTEEVGLF